MQIKHKHILVPGLRYQDSRHLLQNPKVSKSIMGFNNQAQRSTPPYYLDVDNPFMTNSTYYLLDAMNYLSDCEAMNLPMNLNI